MASGLEVVPPQQLTDESAPIRSADFSYPEHPHLQVVDEHYVPPLPTILEPVLDFETGDGEAKPAALVLELNEYVKSLLTNEPQRHHRNRLAALYGDQYRAGLNVDDDEVTDAQYENLLVGRLYFSALSSLGHLSMFIDAKRNYGNKSPEMAEAKSIYLAAKKVYQDDIDEFLDHFEDAPLETVIGTLTDISNLTRLAVTQREFVNSEMDDHTHVFVGSVISERLVKISMQEFLDPDVRYSDEIEDQSPPVGERADVVWPREDGDIYVQVKMKWTKPTNLKVQPKKNPPHVIVPMMKLRTDLTGDEHAKIAEIIGDAAQRIIFERKLAAARAVPGLRKYVAMYRVYANETKSRWGDIKDIIEEGKDPWRALQNRGDAVESSE